MIVRTLLSIERDLFTQSNASRVKKKAGMTSFMFALSLSTIFVCVVCVAAMVVSEMIERLSPSIAPLTTIPAISAGSIPNFCAMPIPIGKKAAIAPIEDPIAVAKKLTITKNPGKIYLIGKINMPILTAACSPPISFNM